MFDILKGIDMQNRFLKRDKASALLNVKTWFRAVLILAPVAAILRTIALYTSFEPEIGYFNDSFFSTLVNWLTIIVPAFILCGFIFISKDADLPKKTPNNANSIFFSATFAGFILLADFAYKLVTLIGEGKLSYYKMVFSSSFRAENAYMLRVTSIIEIIGIASSLLAAACFFVRSAKDPKAKLSAWFGFFPIIRALVGIANIYFDMTVQMNHPSKLIIQFALISVMFYFLCEEREYVSDEHARPRRTFIAGLLAYFMAYVAGFSEIVGFFAGILSEGALFIEAFFCFVLSFYILARVNSFTGNSSAKPVEVVSETTSEEKIDE